MPGLEKLYRDYGGLPDVEFIAIAAEAGNGTAVREAMARWDLTWTPGLDRGFRAIKAYGVQAFPAVFLIGRDGPVEAVHRHTRNAPGQRAGPPRRGAARRARSAAVGLYAQPVPGQPLPRTERGVALRPLVGSDTQGQSRYELAGNPAAVRASLAVSRPAE